MAGIVESIFGPTPEEVRRNQQAEMEQRAALYARQSPMERYSQGLYQAGGQLAEAGAGMLGIEPRQVTEARQREQALSQIDFSTPEGILQGAELARQRGDVRTQLGLQQLAVQRQKEMQPAAEGGARPTVARLLEERSKYPVGSEQYNMLTEAIRKETYIRPEKTGAEEGVTPSGDNIILDFTKPQGRMYRKDHSTDLQQVRSSKLIAEDAIKTSNELLNSKDFNKLFGKGYTGKLTSLTAPDAVKKLDHLKSIMKASGMQQLKGAAGQSIGAMQVGEWKIVENMIDSLDTSMTEEEARNAIKNIEDRISGITSSMKETYDDTWGNFPQLYKQIEFNPEKLKKPSQKQVAQPTSQPKVGVKFLGFE